MGRLRVLDTDPLGFLIQWLDENLPVGIKVGDDRSDDSLPWVTVRSDGGQQTLWWTATTSLGINVWHRTDHEVQELALLVRSWVEHATASHLCQGAICSMPIEVTDSSRDPRRYLTAQVTLSQRLAG